jgi:hypothetical protein
MTNLKLIKGKGARFASSLTEKEFISKFTEPFNNSIELIGALGLLSEKKLESITVDDVWNYCQKHPKALSNPHGVTVNDEGWFPVVNQMMDIIQSKLKIYGKKRF